MGELEDIKGRTKPDEIFLLCDAMAGQDTVRTASEFNRRLDLTGFIMTPDYVAAFFLLVPHHFPYDIVDFSLLYGEGWSTAEIADRSPGSTCRARSKLSPANASPTGR